MKRDTAFVFDLDGVITDPQDSSVDRVAVGHIYKLLEGGNHVAINTGRSYAWVKANLLDMLRGMGGHDHFGNLYIVCEKGGESLVWQGDDFQPQPSRFALSKEVVELCKRVFDEAAPLLTTMFWDATKLTMATIEKRPEASLEQFHQQQVVLVARLREAFAGHDAKIDDTTIATDVELPSAGKHAGAELIYEWFRRQTGAQSATFICFGDSKGDYEMARYFAAQGDKTTFVFVGDKDDDFDEHDGVVLVKTKAMYAAGTREYFLQLGRLLHNGRFS